MNEKENVALLRAGYERWNHDRETAFEHWMDMIADNVRWASLADGAAGMEFTRACGCKADVVRYFEELAAEWEMIHYSVDELIAQGDRVVMIGSCAWRNRRTGKRLDTPKADIIRMKDGKVVEFFEFYDTAKAIAAAS